MISVETMTEKKKKKRELRAGASPNYMDANDDDDDDDDIDDDEGKLMIEKRIKEMIDFYDVDRDGLISYDGTIY